MKYYEVLEGRLNGEGLSREMISAAESFAIPQWNLVMTVTLLALVPPVVVVLVMQRWFVKGLTAGIS